MIGQPDETGSSEDPGEFAYAAMVQAAALLDAGQPHDALSLIARALRDDPNDADLLVLAGHALLQLDQFEDAERVVRQALQYTESPDALRVLGACAARVGDLDLYWSATMRALEIAPDDWTSHVAVAYAAMRTRQRPGTAERAARMAVEIAPTVAATHEALGEVSLQAGWMNDARSAFEAALALDPTSTSARRGLAHTTARSGQTGQAASMLVDLLAKSPASQLARRDLLASLHRTTSRMSLPLGASVALSIAALVWAPRIGLDAETASISASAAEAVAVAIVVVLQIRFFRGTGHRLGMIVRAVRTYGIAIMSQWEALVLATFTTALASVLPGLAKLAGVLPTVILVLLTMASSSRASAELSGRVRSAYERRTRRLERRQMRRIRRAR